MASGEIKISAEAQALESKNLEALLNLMARQIDDNLARGIVEAGALIMTSCKEYTPVDSGLLRASINVTQASKHEVHIAPHTNYAKYVEFGTHKMKGRFYMRRGVAASKARAIAHIKASVKGGQK